MEENQNKAARPVKTGWIILLVSLVFSFVAGFTNGFFSIGVPSFSAIASTIVAMPLVLGSFILAIIAMCKDQPWGGVLLLTATFILPSAAVAIGMMVSLTSGAG